MKNIINEIKELKRKLYFLKSLNSPFKPLTLKFYLGKVAIGTPYFYPRVWKTKPDKSGKYSVPKLIGFDIVGLGWKTKWSDTDYIFEWEPLISFVFFNLQFVVFFVVPEPYHYWTAWLFYENNTDKSSSKSERVKECFAKFPLEFKCYPKIKLGEDSATAFEYKNYYPLILKNKYERIRRTIL